MMETAIQGILLLLVVADLVMVLDYLHEFIKREGFYLIVNEITKADFYKVGFCLSEINRLNAYVLKF